MQQNAPRHVRELRDHPDARRLAEALTDDLTTLPLQTRAWAAHQLLAAGEIDGWDALALAVYGRTLSPD